MDCVKHYRISVLQNGWVYISPRLTFRCLHDLVEHYSGVYWGCNAAFSPKCTKHLMSNIKMFPLFTEFADGLICRLTVPCFIHGLDNSREARPIPIIIRRPTVNWKDISRCGRLSRFCFHQWLPQGVTSTYCRILVPKLSPQAPMPCLFVSHPWTWFVDHWRILQHEPVLLLVEKNTFKNPFSAF